MTSHVVRNSCCALRWRRSDSVAVAKLPATKAMPRNTQKSSRGTSSSYSHGGSHERRSTIGGDPTAGLGIKGSGAVVAGSAGPGMGQEPSSGSEDRLHPSDLCAAELDPPERPARVGAPGPVLGALQG